MPDAHAVLRLISGTICPRIAGLDDRLELAAVVKTLEHLQKYSFLDSGSTKSCLGGGVFITLLATMRLASELPSVFAEKKSPSGAAWRSLERPENAH